MRIEKHPKVLQVRARVTRREEAALERIFLQSIPDNIRSRIRGLSQPGRGGLAASCSCQGCSCPGGNGDYCDAGSMTGYAGGYLGANIG